jgi:hypothetical protein
MRSKIKDMAKNSAEKGLALVGTEKAQDDCVLLFPPGIQPLKHLTANFTISSHSKSKAGSTIAA